MEFDESHEIEHEPAEIETDNLSELDTIPMEFVDQRLDDVDYVASLIEAILLMSPDVIEVSRAAKSLGIKKAVVQNAVEKLKSSYKSRGIVILEVGDGLQFGTNPDIAEHLEKFFQIEKKRRLSRAALQTLSIIAYNQPITKAEIEVFRGNINSAGVIQSLLERDLLKIAGRKETPGNPYLYCVSDEFLRHFGLKDIEDLKAKLPAIEDEIATDGGITQLKLRELGIKSGDSEDEDDQDGANSFDESSNGNPDKEFSASHPDGENESLN